MEVESRPIISLSTLKVCNNEGQVITKQESKPQVTVTPDTQSRLSRSITRSVEKSIGRSRLNKMLFLEKQLLDVSEK